MHIFTLMFSFNYGVFDMFRSFKCSSSGRLVHAVLWYVKFANAQQADKYINTRTRKKNCTKPMQRYGIIKQAGKTTNAKLYINQVEQ
jgi:hypothetical protein